MALRDRQIRGAIHRGRIAVTVIGRVGLAAAGDAGRVGHRAGRGRGHVERDVGIGPGDRQGVRAGARDRSRPAAAPAGAARAAERQTSGLDIRDRDEAAGRGRTGIADSDGVGGRRAEREVADVRLVDRQVGCGGHDDRTRQDKGIAGVVAAVGGPERPEVGVVRAWGDGSNRREGLRLKVPTAAWSGVSAHGVVNVPGFVEAYSTPSKTSSHRRRRVRGRDVTAAVIGEPAGTVMLAPRSRSRS